MPKDTHPAIKHRFYQAFDSLISVGIIKTEHYFCVKHEINRRNFNDARLSITRDPTLAWIAILVLEYRVSGDWILTGMGKMYRN